MSFSSAMDDLDAAVEASLSDGECQHLSRNGQVLVEALPYDTDAEAERVDMQSGLVSTVRTISVRKSRLQPYDRQGAFLVEGVTWHIDGIGRDDGRFISFYVVP